MKRETGFYRVKYKVWMCAFYNSETEIWNLIGSEINYSDSKFSEINETKIIFDVKEASDKEILDLYSCLIRYGYQEAIDEIVNFVSDNCEKEELGGLIQDKLSKMTSTKKEINFEKLQKEL